MNLFINLSLSKFSTTPFFVMPIGLLSIVSYLRGLGKKVKLVDFNVLSRKMQREEYSVINDFTDLLNKEKPLVVGISVMVAAQVITANAICKIVKELLPGSTTVVGGAHVSQFPKEILNACQEIDFVVIGEGEEQAAYVAEYAKTREHTGTIPGGIAYRADKLTVVPKKEYISDMDNLPYPAYDIINFEEYRHDTSTWHNPHKVDLSLRVPIITSRGCPNVCNFCSVSKCMGLAHRAMSPKKVVDLIQGLHEKRGVSYFTIFDANFAQDVNRVLQICNEILKRNLKIYLDLPTGLPITATAPSMIDALASAGLIRTCISVETGDEIIRNKIMRKCIESSSISLLIHTIRKYPQIFLLADFVIGMPEETEESLEHSYQLAQQLNIDDIVISVATPYPGTPLFDQCVKDNLFTEEIDKDKLYNTERYSHSNIDTFTIKPYNLSIEKLRYYRDKILKVRKGKVASYKKRMIENNYV